LSYGRYRDRLEEAVDDLEAARRLFEFSMWSKVCFFHQAAGKALKALCIKKLGRYVQTHSVARLLEELGGAVELP
jgi:HEPN domain-containing protein